MKKVLLTTTALAMTAGVASAEITFSGNGEAGFYRTGASKAVAAKVGTQTGVQSSANDNGTDVALGAAPAATAAVFPVNPRSISTP